MDIKSSEFFRNIKTLPPKGNSDDPNKEYLDLIKWETDKCLGGVRINGIYIPGWLYWHLNHWWINIDIRDNYGNIVRKDSLPHLRDNEWIISDAIERAKVEQVAVLIAGARQIAKSEIQASYIGYNAELFYRSQNVIVGGSDDDLKLLQEKISFGIKMGWEGMFVPRLDKDWRKHMVRLGYKGTDNEDQVWSYIIVRNAAEGINTEGPAGVTAKAFVNDEIAKYAFAAPYEAAKPAFVSEFGWRAIPLLCCTGGNADKFSDAERYFNHPKANKILAFMDPISGKETGLFMSGLYRNDCKYESTLADYLISTGAISAEQDLSELKKIPMRVSDKVKALDVIKEERLLKSKDPDQSTYRKQIMYYPLTPQECFLSSTSNYYNSELAKRQKDRLEEKFPGLNIGMRVELEEQPDGSILSNPSNKVPISTFPTESTEDLDTPIVILEHPIKGASWGLYVAGVDPYKFDQAKYSDSLGAVYIFKRMYDVEGDDYQDMLVAWYVGRPKEKSTWNNTARLLIKYYNANALCENDDMSFIDYMISKNEGYYLADTPDWLREYIPTSSTLLRPKGISRSSSRIRDFLRTTLKQYMEETFAVYEKIGDTEQKKVFGVSKINDPVFLDEIIKWNPDGNFDREIAVSLALVHAKKLDNLKIRSQITETDPRFSVPVDIYGRRIIKQRNKMFSEIPISKVQGSINNLFK